MQHTLMKTFRAHTALFILLLLISGCATTHSDTNWLNNAQKIDEENNHK
jgi:predicted component of type VI protein secretion system